MSDITQLKELAGFVGKSAFASEDSHQRRLAVNGMIARIEHRPLSRKASDLLGAVLALSARTRRVVQPRVEIDLDVFMPSGQRAIKLSMRAIR